MKYPTKRVLLVDLKSLIIGEEDNEYSKFVTPILAQTGCVRYAGYYKGGKLIREKVAFVLPAGRHDYNYCGQIFPDVGFPGLLFIFTLMPTTGGEKVLTNTKLYALGEGVLKDSTELFWYPFGNASTFVCWGDFGQVKVKDIFELRGLPYAFLQLEKNDDLFNSSRNSRGWCQREVLKHLSGRDFDYSLLVPNGEIFGEEIL